MTTDKPNLTLVETLHPDMNAPLCSLFDRIEAVIDDYCAKHNSPVTRAEIVGTLEFLKNHYMESK